MTGTITKVVSIGGKMVGGFKFTNLDNMAPDLLKDLKNMGATGKLPDAKGSKSIQVMYFMLVHIY